jgi:hypothetical protein
MARLRWMRRRAIVLAVAALGVVAIGGTALAGHITSGVKSYTGCLASPGGTLSLIKEGDSPQRRCPDGQQEAHFSGGDITAVRTPAGSGLTGGGENGALSLSLDAGHSLPQSCNSFEFPMQSNGSRWVCANHVAGTGLTTAGSSVSGTSGTTKYSIRSEYQVKNDPDCTSGKFATGFEDDGDIICATPPSASGVEVWQGTRGVTFLPKNEGVDLVMLSLPAGTYLITGVATVSDWSGGARGDEELTVSCKLRNGAFADLPAQESEVDIGEESTDNVGPAGTAVVHGLVPLASADTVRFTCFSRGGDDESDEARNVTMTAVRVGTVHGS